MTRVLLIFCATVCLLQVQTDLVRAEIVLTGTAGHNAELTCVTKPSTSVSWQYRRERTDPEQYICIDGTVLLSWQHKYSLAAVDSSSGKFVLTVKSADFNDSGIYSCIEEGGIGDKNSVQLQVVAEVESTEPTTSIIDHQAECRCSTSSGLSVVIIFLVVCILVVLIIYFVYSVRRRKFATYELHAVVKDQTSSERRKLLQAEVTDDKGECKQESATAAAAAAGVVRAEDRNLNASQNENTDIVGKTVAHRVINKDTWVSGVTIVNNSIYLLRGKLLHVYNSITYCRLESHTIDRLYRHYRNDLASSTDHQCLYISDYYHKNILRISLPMSSSEKATSAWEQECRPSGLSVTRSHTLLVTSFDACRLVEINNDGVTVREIKLESDIEWPMHAIQLGSGNFVVCHGGDGVWLVDSKGCIKETYDGEKSCSEGHLAWPCHVAVRKDGSILVADHYNDRILQLNADLRYVGEAVHRHQLRRPRRLYLNSDTERLYVGQCNGELTYFDLQ